MPAPIQLSWCVTVGLATYAADRRAWSIVGIAPALLPAAARLERLLRGTHGPFELTPERFA